MTVPSAPTPRRRVAWAAGALLSPGFTAGSGLLALGIVFVIPSQLFCITLPLGVLALAVALALLYSTRR